MTNLAELPVPSQSSLSLALSGGGARGIAHLGVLAAINELELPIRALAGASSGGIMSAFYAAGIAPREVLHLIKTTNVPRLTRLVFSRHGLLGLEAVERLKGHAWPGNARELWNAC